MQGKVGTSASTQLGSIVTYTVQSGAGTGTRTVHASLGGLSFTAGPIATGGALSVTLSKAGSNTWARTACPPRASEPARTSSR